MKKRANGEGTIYTTIQRNKRKVFLDKECNVCKHCTNKCNRINFERCDKCKNCTECLKYCDRYYCYKTTKAQISIKNERKSAGTGKNSKEVKEKKELKTKEFNIKQLIKNGELTLSEVMREIESDKLDKTLISQNSYNRNIDTIQKIENFDISTTKMFELTQEHFKELMALLVKLKTSQSCLDKIYDEIHQACRVCNRLDIFEDIDRNTFVSNIDCKEVQAFTLEEEKLLLTYINENKDTLVNPQKCDIDSITVKNIIKLSFASSMRIGELCSLDKNEDIDEELKKFIVRHTITKDSERKSVIGNTTKTGRKKKQSGKKDSRDVPFDILFDENEVLSIVEEQKQHSMNNLLFSTKDGKLIEHSSFNVIFKRICKEAGIEKDCNVHMIKHTGVTRMLESGIDIYAISKIVGTSVRVLTKTYAHILDDFVDSEIKKAKKVRENNNLSLEKNSISNCKIISFASYR